MDYKKQTEEYYKDDEKAADYHHWFNTAKGIDGMRFRLIADLERKAVRQLLARVPHDSVIDVPTGTGKMAPVFLELGSSVLACDVSPNMLRIAEGVYRDAGVRVQARELDLLHASAAGIPKHDAVVCVRLMHRVPDEIKKRMLAEIAGLAAHAVISFAINSRYQRIRDTVRRRVMRKGSDADDMHREVVATWPTRDELDALLSEQFEVIAVRHVALVLSSEVMFLVRSKKFANAPS